MRLRRDLPSGVQEALADGDKIMKRDRSGNIHSVGWGEERTDGELTGDQTVIFTVKKKCENPSGIGSIYVAPMLHGEYTDVIEAPQAEVAVLFPDRMWPYTAPVEALAGESHRQCYDSPIPGGVRIMPEGKQWAGTLGCKVIARGKNGLYHAAITNCHVATADVGQKLIQPANVSRPWFATVAFSPGIKFGGQVNKIDISVLDILRMGGEYGDGTHTVKPEQLTLGRYKKELCKCGVGAVVARDGSTLGRVDDGRCTQVGVSIQVSYGPNGVALFTDQFVVKGSTGLFSAPGDSGSMVFQYPEMLPFGLLFAGGEGMTVVSPAEFVLEYGNVHSFQ